MSKEFPATYEEYIANQEPPEILCDCGRGPILQGNMVPEVCIACFVEQELWEDLP